MAQNVFSLPELFPTPKELSVLEGESNLALDVRLVTTNVYPLERKAIRSVLTAAGVRVVANKKTYSVDARVEGADAFDMKDVPEFARKEYYELTLQGSEVIIRAPEQIGTVWGVRAAATIFQVFQQGVKLPNLFIRDWPMIPNRGMFLASNALSDRMTLVEWMQLIDTLSALKMNFLGLEIFSNAPSPRLLIPIAEHDDWRTVKRLEWYSATKDISGVEEFAPYLAEKPELFTSVVNYGEEKGVHITPIINLFEGCDFLAGKLPAYAAKDKNGKATGKGACFSTDEARTAFQGILDGMMTSLFPNGVRYFCLNLKAPAVTCKCKACAKRKAGELTNEYALWAAKLIGNYKVQNLLLMQDGIATKEFEKAIAEAGLKDKTVVLWDDPVVPNAAPWKKSTLRGWASLPMDTGISDADKIKKLTAFYCSAEKGAADGVVYGSTYRPTHLENEALLGSLAWESGKKAKSAAIVKHWNELQFGKSAGEIAKAQALIAEASKCPQYAICLPDESGENNYPEAALQILEKDKKAMEALQTASETAAKAEEILKKVLSDETIQEPQQGLFKMMLAEASHIDAMTEGMRYLLELRGQLAPGAVTKKMATATTAAKDSLAVKTEFVETGFPLWLSPYFLNNAGKLYRFYDQLVSDLKDYAGKKQASKIRWK